MPSKKKTANMRQEHPLGEERKLFPLQVERSGQPLLEARRVKRAKKGKANRRVDGVVANAEAGVANEVAEEAALGLRWNLRAMHSLLM